MKTSTKAVIIFILFMSFFFLYIAIWDYINDRDMYTPIHFVNFVGWWTWALHLYIDSKFDKEDKTD